MFELDIELSLGDLANDRVELISKKLPDDYFIEDRRELGWGNVIRLSEKKSTVLDRDIQSAVEKFLDGLQAMADLISENNENVLRVGIYYDTVTFTFRFVSSE